MNEINFDINRVGMKEMFANCGLAMLRASYLEKSLMLLLVAVNQIGKPEVTSDDINSVIFADNEKTFGQLLNKLKSKITLSADLEEEIRQSVSKRNYLAHNFFFQNRNNLISGDPALLSRELQELGNFFLAVYPKVDHLLGIFLKQFNVPYANVDQEVVKLISKKR
jgi:hypothetical protein